MSRATKSFVVWLILGLLVFLAGSGAINILDRLHGTYASNWWLVGCAIAACAVSHWLVAGVEEWP